MEQSTTYKFRDKLAYAFGYPTIILFAIITCLHLFDLIAFFNDQYDFINKVIKNFMYNYPLWVTFLVSSFIGFIVYLFLSSTVSSIFQVRKDNHYVLLQNVGLVDSTLLILLITTFVIPSVYFILEELGHLLYFIIFAAIIVPLFIVNIVFAHLTTDAKRKRSLEKDKKYAIVTLVISTILLTLITIYRFNIIKVDLMTPSVVFDIVVIVLTYFYITSNTFSVFAFDAVNHDIMILSDPNKDNYPMFMGVRYDPRLKNKHNKKIMLITGIVASLFVICLFLSTVIIRTLPVA